LPVELALGFIPPSLSLALELRRAVQVWMVPRRSSSPKFGAKACHPLILDGLCLHVLSSFQRTGNGPAKTAPDSRSPLDSQTVRRGTYQTYDNFVSRVNSLHSCGAKPWFLTETRCRWALPGGLELPCGFLAEFLVRRTRLTGPYLSVPAVPRKSRAPITAESRKPVQDRHCPPQS